MQPRNPVFVTINNHRVKVQRWQQFTDRFELTTLVHGDAHGTELLVQLREQCVTVAWTDSPAIEARPDLTHHRIAGTGPTAVHRIEVTLWISSATPEYPPSSNDDKLDLILAELRLLRDEVAALRAHVGGPASAQPSPLTSGRTLLDFEIKTEQPE